MHSSRRGGRYVLRFCFSRRFLPTEPRRSPTTDYLLQTRHKTSRVDTLFDDRTTISRKQQQQQQQIVIMSSKNAQLIPSQALPVGRGQPSLASSPTENPSLQDGKTDKKKKKTRYTQQQKRDHKAAREAVEASQTHTRQIPKEMKPRTPLTWLQRVQQCIGQAQSTKSLVLDGNASQQLEQDWIRVVTCSSLEGSRRHAPPTPSSFELSEVSTPPVTTVRVQPLLILDLNGVLCHRSRKHKEPEGVQLRHPIDTIANTHIVPRTDVVPFLRSLQQSFCLAVWTSAKPKTADSLLKLLLPQDIRDELLFVWTQNQCVMRRPDNPTIIAAAAAVGTSREKNVSTTHNKHHKKPRSTHPQQHHQPYDDGIVFEKRLDQVWRAFPLWNANNTLLMDDSPDKCPFAMENAIHPPPLHGQRCPPRLSQKNTIDATSDDNDDDDRDGDVSGDRSEASPIWVPDQENERQQGAFFQRYSQFWQDHAHSEFLTKYTVPSLALKQKQVHQRVTESSSPSTDNVSMDRTAAPQVEVRERITNDSFRDCLKEHGLGHMGWRQY